ncbi:transporter substrate-binding domain-containing protein [Egicoccus halophilus]|uniref:Basic amino acid ABC transporter substrate-binding protein n=1 Tax=Egicoccus halophilus TaxID=1670830 RepID=A0A8J3AD73_9ACTN|nr:transporter substrate-binding domain-containing protein [Egicoccus halophilus]GGI04417.1 basic amino acid ABC transporter substrate-binding protein [Egicoccus halophilus]
MRATTRRAAAAAAALTLVLTACGDDGDTTDGGTTDAPAETDDGTDDDAAGDETDDETTETDGEAAAELELVQDGVLTVCSEVPYEPFQFEDPDHPTGYSGFDIEIAYEIAQDAGLDMEVVNTGFEGLTSGATMAAGTCDMAASAITITEERAEQIEFSEPYYESLQSLLVPADSEIASIEDLTEEYVVGVQSGTTGADYAEENVPGATITEFAGGGDLFTALAAGSIDAILQDEPVNRARAAQDEGIEVIEEYDTDETYGFAFEQDRPDELVQVVNDGIAQLREDGRYDELFEQYFAVVE